MILYSILLYLIILYSHVLYSTVLNSTVLYVRVYSFLVDRSILVCDAVNQNDSH